MDVQTGLRLNLKSGLSFENLTLDHGLDIGQDIMMPCVSTQSLCRRTCGSEAITPITDKQIPPKVNRKFSIEE